MNPKNIDRGTPGFSGADLANVVNEAALFAARHNKTTVDMLDLEYAKDKIMMGAERKSMVMSESEKEMITSTQFPISSLMILMGQWEGKNVEKHVSLRQCAEIIAFERVAEYVEQIVKTLLVQTEASQSKQIEQESFESFKKGLEHTLVRIERLKTDNYRKMSEKQKIIQFLIDIEKNLRDKPGANL